MLSQILAMFLTTRTLLAAVLGVVLSVSVWLALTDNIYERRGLLVTLMPTFILLSYIIISYTENTPDRIVDDFRSHTAQVKGRMCPF